MTGSRSFITDTRLLVKSYSQVTGRKGWGDMREGGNIRGFRMYCDGCMHNMTWMYYSLMAVVSREGGGLQNGLECDHYWA